MDKAAALDQVWEDYRKTPVLRELSEGSPLVHGAGPLEAPLVIVGEAPGRVETEQGQPFAGPAGQELQRLFARADLPWEFFYRTNVIPWRPPGNRTPYPFEIQASAARLAREIAIIGPLIVIAAGATAWKGLTGGRAGAFGYARGQWSEWKPEGEDIRCDLLVIWHPSAILHASGARAEQMREETVTALRSVMGDAHAS